jgi:pyruvate dehydrogenase E1 component alpha subunit
LISNEKLIELYAAMVKCRMMADRAGKMLRDGRLVTGLEPGFGREATIAGVVEDLLPQDTLIPERGNPAATFVKGTKLERFFASLAVSRNGRGHSAAQRDGAETSASGGQLDGACEAAKTHKALKKGGIVVAFYKDEQVERQKLREKLSLASRESLPVTFVCPQGLRDRLGKEPSQGKNGKNAAEALESGVPVISVDGNDVIAVYRVASESIARARQRRGPTLIECIYDGSLEFGSNGKGKDPLLTMEAYLDGKELFKPGLRRQIEDRFLRKLDRATNSEGRAMTRRTVGG